MTFGAVASPPAWVVKSVRRLPEMSIGFGALASSYRPTMQNSTSRRAAVRQISPQAMRACVAIPWA